MISKLLYLTYIPMGDLPVSGSSVRPQKMKEALESLGIQVKTFGGANNDLALRKKTVAEIRALLREWKPDACYIEPPSGPLFYYGDVLLIRQLRRMGVPLSIFYRDAYWKYPEFSAEKKLSAPERFKRFVIKQMQVSQWNTIKKNIDLIYFPSMSMAKEFDCPRKDALPPGSFLPNAKEKTELSDPLRFIFIGGASRNYGTYLTLEAFEILNRSSLRAKLTYVCPENQWASLGIDIEKYRAWLDVIHTSGDDNLRSLYENADVALLTAPKTFYRDFAVPIKIFEYISYLKPILVTDCTETAKIVRENRVGWVTKDDADSVAEKLDELCSHPEEILEIRSRMEAARRENLWSSRAGKVIRDLDGIRSAAADAAN